MRKKLSIIIVLALTLIAIDRTPTSALPLLPNTYSATVQPLAVTAVTFTPTDDSYIKESRPTRNYGSDGAINVDVSSRKDALVRFDISGIGAQNVTNATLRLYAIDGSDFGGEFFKMNDANWSEGAATWASAPPGDGGLLGSLGRVDSGTWYELDVPSLVTGDGPVSIRGSSTNSDGADYAAKENSNGFTPELVVTIGDPPPPDFTPPTVPGNLVTTDVQATSISLSWDAASDNIGVTNYDIFRDGNPLASVGSVTSYQDNTVAPETTYQYTVGARDATGNTSGPSNIVNVTTPTAPDLAFDISRDGSTYHAVARTTPSSYTGSLKDVVESAADELTSSGGGSIFFDAGDFDLGSDHFELTDVNDVTFAGQGIDVSLPEVTWFYVRIS